MAYTSPNRPVQQHSIMSWESGDLPERCRHPFTPDPSLAYPPLRAGSMAPHHVSGSPDPSLPSRSTPLQARPASLRPPAPAPAGQQRALGEKDCRGKAACQGPGPAVRAWRRGAVLQRPGRAPRGQQWCRQPRYSVCEGGRLLLLPCR